MILRKFFTLILFTAFAQSMSALPAQMPMPVVDAADNDAPIVPSNASESSLVPSVLPEPPTTLARADLAVHNPADDIVFEDEEPLAGKAPIHAKHSQKTPKGIKNAGVKSKVTGQKPDIYLNFENSTLANVVNYMAELRNINLLPDKALGDVKVSLTIREPLTVDGAWKIFLTLLEVSGYSIVEVDGLHKVMAKDKKLTEALPSYINVPYTTLPDSDLTIRYVMFLQNLQVDAVKDLLESLLSDNKRVFPYAQANCFIITDRCYNIKAAMKVIQELDTMGQAETVVVMRLKRTNATDVKALLEGLMKKADNNPLARLFAKSSDTSTEYFPSGTKIVAEDRTNSLILMGSPDPIKKIEKFIVEYIDVELKAAESPLHIYELQYADATQIAEILKEVTAAPDQGPGQQAAKYGAIRGGVKYFKSMKFQVDKEGNRLIVSCTDKTDWDMLKGIIKDLDKPQPQVAIETMFVSITAKDLDQMGGGIRNPSASTLGGNVNFQSANISGVTLSQPADPNKDPVTLLGNMLNQLIKGAGSTLLSFGKKTNIWSVFEMIRTRSNATILSQPFLTIANKVTGKISVGEERQVLQDEGAGGVKGYTPANADTVVEIEPQINIDGIIRMKVSVDINEFTNAAQGEKSTKKVGTNVTMADGQVLILGGFIQTKVSENFARTPLLSNIPILGWFFKNQSRSVDRTYIFIFMAPTIVKPRTAPGVELYSKMKLHSATDNIENSISTVKSNDPLFNWFFDPKKENYSHKVVDFANARYQPTTVDVKHDSYYRTNVTNEENKLIHHQPVFADAPTVMIDSPVSTAQSPTVDTPLAPVEPEILVSSPTKNTTSAPLAPIKPPSQPTAAATNINANDDAATEPLHSETPPVATPIETPATPNLAKNLVQERLGLNHQQTAHALSQEPMQGEHTPAHITPPAVEAHPAQQDVLAMLNNRMQEKRLVSVDDAHLATQRKKLKSLISQAYSPAAAHNNSTTQSKQQGLKALLEVPKPKQAKHPELIIDPAKRNSLKDFLLHAEPPTNAARNNQT